MIYIGLIIALLVGGIAVLKQYRRVDRYRQRISTLSAILFLPAAALLTNILIALVGVYDHDAVYIIVALIASPWALLALTIVAIIGLICLWRLLGLPDKLYWEPLPDSSLSKAQRKQQKRGLRLQRIGFWFFSVPLVFAIVMSFAISMLVFGQGGGLVGGVVLGYVSLTFLYVGVPCIVAGLVCFAKSKM